MARLIFWFSLSVYCLCSSGHLGSYDAWREYCVAKSFVESGTFELPREMFSVQDGALGRDGRLYCWHSPGMSALILPLYCASKVIVRMVSKEDVDSLGKFLVSFLNIFFTAGINALLYKTLRQMDLSLRWSLIFSLTGGFATLLFPYSKVAFDVLPAGFFLLAAVYFLEEYKKDVRVVHLLYSQLFLAAAIFVRIPIILLIPAFFLYSGILLQRQRWTALPVFFSPLIFVGMVIGAYNHLRFGSIFEDGRYNDDGSQFSGDWVEGILGLLISPGKGLLVYSPILVFAMLGTFLVFRHKKGKGFFWAYIILSQLILHAGIRDWHGAWCWGSRFLVYLIPFFIFFAAQTVQLLNQYRYKILFIALTGASLFIQGLGVSYDGGTRIGNRLQYEKISYRRIIFDPAGSPIIDHFKQITKIVSGQASAEEPQKPYYKIQDDHFDFLFVYATTLGVPVFFSFLWVFSLSGWVGWLAFIILKYVKDPPSIA